VTSQSQSTVTVRCETSAGGADVGAQVVLAMAARAGIPPLAADRLRGDVRDALRAASGVVDLVCTSDEDSLTITISSPGEALEGLRTALDGHAAEISDGVVLVRVRRTPLRSV
jgi:hypothetical protein